MKIRSFTKNDIEFTEVVNQLGFKVIFASLGASIFLVRDNGYVLNRNVKDIENFKDPYIYYGKTIGRVSNRIRGNKISLHNEIFSLKPKRTPKLSQGKEGF